MAWIFDLILDWLLGKVIAFLVAFNATFKARDQIKKDADASVGPLENAESAEEIDAATDEALNGF